jgi:hypothetical protein
MACDCTSSTNCGTNSRCYAASATITEPYCGCANNSFCPPGSTCNTTTGICS